MPIRKYYKGEIEIEGYGILHPKTTTDCVYDDVNGTDLKETLLNLSTFEKELKFKANIKDVNSAMEKKLDKVNSMQFLIEPTNWDNSNKAIFEHKGVYNSNSQLELKYVSTKGIVDKNSEICNNANITIFDVSDTTITFMCSAKPADPCVVLPLNTGVDGSIVYSTEIDEAGVLNYYKHQNKKKYKRDVKLLPYSVDSNTYVLAHCDGIEADMLYGLQFSGEVNVNKIDQKLGTGCFQFTNTVLSTINNTFANTDDITLEFWFKYKNKSDIQVAAWAQTTGILQLNDTANSSYFNLFESEGFLGVMINGASSPACQFEVGYDNLTNLWNRFIMKKTGKEYKFYFENENGAKSATYAETGEIQQSSIVQLEWCHIVSSSYAILIDELRISKGDAAINYKEIVWEEVMQ